MKERAIFCPAESFFRCSHALHVSPALARSKSDGPDGVAGYAVSLHDKPKCTVNVERVPLTENPSKVRLSCMYDDNLLNGSATTSG